MSTWTKATLATRTLEYLAVVGEGESPTSQQQTRAEEIVDSVYPQLRKMGLAPFAVSAIPEWAQMPMVKYLAPDIAPRFGFSGQRLMELMAGQRKGRMELEEQVAAYAHQLPIEVDYF